MSRPDKKRCPWVPLTKPFYVKYHDEEWGRPVHDDIRHFEFLSLGGAQAGLSWEMILKKRKGYRKAFAGFDPKKVARFTSKRVEKLLLDPGIVRNRQKVESTVKNAKAFLKIRKEFGSFDKYVWAFVGGEPRKNRRRTIADYPARSEESDALSEDLRKRGLRFVGSTIVYAYLQAAGLVNDHSVDCWVRTP
jgi:DNA-3-methyladenine glycosylase I